MKKDKLKDPLNDSRSTRRHFLNRIWLLLAAVGLAEFVWLVFSYFKPRRSRPVASASGTVIAAGAVEDFKPGTVTAYPRGRFYLVCLEDRGFLALSRQCTHLGCTVSWIEEDARFACPCHASAFDITGSVLNPPASRPLDLFNVFIENNTIWVDTAKRIRRSRFDIEQIAYASSSASQST